MPNVTRGIKTKIQLDGEQEFKDAISNINAGLGVLDSELRKIKAQYQDNADSVEALTAMSDAYERKLYTQKDKVEEYRKQLQKLKEDNGEANEETMRMEKLLNDAEAQLYNTEAALKRTNAALEEAKNGTQVTGISFKEFATGAVAAVGTVVVAVKALIDVEKSLIDITAQAAERAGEIRDTSQKLGWSVEDVQEIQYAAELIGTSFETVQGANTKLIRAMSSAQSGTKKTAEAFEQLGVSFENSDGSLRNSTDVFYDVIDALGQVENETERDALAMEILGKSAMELNPLIVQGSEAFQDFRDYASDAGFVLTEEMVTALEAVDDAHVNLQKQQQATKDQIAIYLAPTVEEFYKALTEFIKEAGQAFVDSGMLDMLKEMLQSFTDFLKEVTSANEEGLPNLEQRFSTLKTVLYDVALLVASIKDTFNVLVNLNPWGIANGGLKNALGFGYSSGNPNNYQTVKMKQDGTWGEYQSWEGFNANASGDYNFKGGLTWVGENGPELVSLPSGSSINTAQDSRNMGTNNYYITIDAKNVREFNDIVAMAQNSRVASRMRG